MTDTPKHSPREAAQRLSSLMDGELEPTECSDVFARWSGDASQRGTWHAYHLIGDVLRSEELACSTGDEAFVQRLRLRMAAEPVVLAPRASTVLNADEPAVAQPTVAQSVGGPMRARRRLRWAAPFGAAAGVAAVAVTAWMVRPDAPAPLEVAEAPRAAARGVVVSGVITEPGQAVRPASAVLTAAAASAAPTLGSGGAVTVLRDPQVDRYLNAHRGLSVAPGLGPSAIFIRNATFEVTGQ